MSDEFDLLGASLTTFEAVLLVVRLFASALLVAGHVHLARAVRRPDLVALVALVAAAEVAVIAFAVVYQTQDPVEDAILTGAFVGGVAWVGIAMSPRHWVGKVVLAPVLPVMGALVFAIAPLSPMPGRRALLPSAARCIAALDRAKLPDPRLYVGEESYELVTDDGRRYLFAIVDRSPNDYRAVLCGHDPRDEALDRGLRALPRRLDGGAPSKLAARLELATRWPNLGTVVRQRGRYSYEIENTDEARRGAR